MPNAQGSRAEVILNKIDAQDSRVEVLFRKTDSRPGLVSNNYFKAVTNGPMRNLKMGYRKKGLQGLGKALSDFELLKQQLGFGKAQYRVKKIPQPHNIESSPRDWLREFSG